MVVLVSSTPPAFAHHLMGGRAPASFGEGILSGLGHPIIGLDHFAAVVAVGCLAAAHRSAYSLVIVFVLAMMGGVALHLHGATVPGAEILVALSVGESIYGAEPTPLYAYLLGLAVVQCAIALAAVAVARNLIKRKGADLSSLRLVGAGIAGIGVAVLMQQVIPGA